MLSWLVEQFRQARTKRPRLVQRAVGWGSVIPVGGFAVAAFLAALNDIDFLPAVATPPNGLARAAFQGVATLISGGLFVLALRRLTKAWRESWDEQPVRIWVLGKTQMQSKPCGSSIIDSFTASVRLENRSDDKTHRCTLRVFSVVEPIDFQLPRFVASLTLPPNGEVPVNVVAWTRRSPPLKDDPRIYVIGGPITSHAVLAYLPAELRQIELEVSTDGKLPHRTMCQVWVDADRKLRLEKA